MGKGAMRVINRLANIAAELNGVEKACARGAERGASAGDRLQPGVGQA